MEPSNSAVTANASLAQGSAEATKVRKWTVGLVALSALYLLLACAYVALLYWNAGSFVLPRPSVLGDFLAGVFSPLAFLWLVYGYFLQTDELSLQRAELAAMREAQEGQAKELARAAEAAEREVSLRELEQKAGTEPAITLEILNRSAGTIYITVTNTGATARQVDFFCLTAGWRVVSAPLEQCTIWTRDKREIEIWGAHEVQDQQVYVDVRYTSASDLIRKSAGFLIQPDNRILPQPVIVLE